MSLRDITRAPGSAWRWVRGLRWSARAATLCFAAGTLVLTQDGLKPIEDVAIGERVWSRSEDGDDTEGFEPVVQVFVTEDKPVLELTFAADNGEQETLRVTAEHPLWSLDRATWQTAGTLRLGERVHALRGAMLLIAALVMPQTQTVYNLEVESAHTYFVGEAGLWAHNTCTKGVGAAEGAGEGARFITNTAGRTLDMRTFQGLARNPRTLTVGRSGAGRALTGPANSYSLTNGGHALVYGPDGRILYDVSASRIKAFQWSQTPSGEWFARTGSNLKFSEVPQEVLNALGL